MQSGKTLMWQLEQFGGRSAQTRHESLHHAALPQVCQAASACPAWVPATAIAQVPLALHALMHGSLATAGCGDSCPQPSYIGLASASPSLSHFAYPCSGLCTLTA